MNQVIGEHFSSRDITNLFRETPFPPTWASVSLYKLFLFWPTYISTYVPTPPTFRGNVEAICHASDDIPSSAGIVPPMILRA